MQELRAPLQNFLVLASKISTSTRPNCNPIDNPVADKGHPTNPQSWDSRHHHHLLLVHGRLRDALTELCGALALQ
eukprot:CAMPEP_0177380714 /NCGR_PEP_ID=MMETSP0368-20130122/47663_1 /TAXON_ID=447022 ORGANISM="Scrippsiella hangoei-like, Strain SHHI-4" /NCGR_SAMPLE_ID=MMETSP0368 /ASSEMBLY_ACC=CAM_ASM_000363 /LENGTH=74 /DNA_ID=CAMNT_0018845045 /DNA_START=74 /DNA_END=295 /DNA_ORIENTATION=-